MRNKGNIALIKKIIAILSGKFILLVIIFLVAFIVRYESLTKMGKTWDEGYPITGYEFIKLFFEKNFSSSFWYLQSDHPPFARYLYGLAVYFDPATKIVNGVTTFSYALFWPRLVSVVFGSLSSTIVGLIGFKYFSKYTAFASGIIFALIPFFVGLSQIATLESFIMFFFTLTVYFYIDFLSTESSKSLYFTGVTLGLNLLVKQSNLIIIPLLIIIYFIWFAYNKKKTLKLFFGRKFTAFFLIALIGFITFFVLWPMPFLHFKEVWAVQDRMWMKAVKLPPPEVFFGRLMLVPFPYYIIMFIITTPLLLLILSFLGFLKIDRKKTFISMSIVAWFTLPFFQSFYAFKQHGVRYIIEIYAPFSLLCGIGLSYFNSLLPIKKFVQLITFVFVVFYFCLVLSKIRPYYLDYFSEVVGGNNYVYSHKLFQMGWWGQGIGPAVFYISKSEHRNVTVAVSGPQPAQVVPDLGNIKLMYYDKKKTYDYVLVPYFDVVRLGFPEEELLEKYEIVHSINIDKAKLVKIYKKII